MDKKILKRYRLTGLASFSAVLLVVYVISAVWSGYAYTASGIPVPDTGLTIPVLLFLIFSAGQMVAIIFNKPALSAILCTAKIILFAVLLYLLCGYALYIDYMNAGIDNGFYSNLTYSILVIASAATAAMSLVFELVTGLLSVRADPEDNGDGKSVSSQ